MKSLEVGGMGGGFPERTGPGVAAGETSYALANSTDLFATILEMAGVDYRESVPDDIALDTVSLMPYLSDPGRESIREWVYADAFTTDLGVRSGEYAIRGLRFKYLVDQSVEHFFDLEVDPYEHTNLLDGELTADQSAAFDRLKSQVDALHASEF